MPLELLKLLLLVRQFSPAELARRADLSRQAVSLWFCNAKGKRAPQLIDMRVETFRKVAAALQVDAGALLNLAERGFSDFNERRLEARFNWDKHYPDIYAWLSAVANREARAIARLVQVVGLFKAAKIAGRPVWQTYEKYSRFIAPARRKQCELIWKMQHDLKLI